MTEEAKPEKYEGDIKGEFTAKQAVTNVLADEGVWFTAYTIYISQGEDDESAAQEADATLKQFKKRFRGEAA